MNHLQTGGGMNHLQTGGGAISHWGEMNHLQTGGICKLGGHQSAPPRLQMGQESHLNTEFREGIMKSLTFARDMVCSKLVAALGVTVTLTVVLEDLRGLSVVLPHPLQVICQPLTA